MLRPRRDCRNVHGSDDTLTKCPVEALVRPGCSLYLSHCRQAAAAKLANLASFGIGGSSKTQCRNCRVFFAVRFLLQVLATRSSSGLHVRRLDVG